MANRTPPPAGWEARFWSLLSPRTAELLRAELEPKKPLMRRMSRTCEASGASRPQQANPAD